MVTTAQVIQILEKMAQVIQENKDYLTELDMPIGDSDHGINLARGFQAVTAKLPTVADKDIGTILKTVGMTLVSTVGGASGPLYGTAFLRAAGKAAGKSSLELNDFLDMMDAAIEGVKMRGKATVGEQTMLDAMVPALAGIGAAAQHGRRRAGGHESHHPHGCHQRPCQLPWRTQHWSSGPRCHFVHPAAGCNCSAGTGGLTWLAL